MLNETRRQLTANGFVEEPPGFLAGDSLVQFTRPIESSPFKIGASWSNEPNEHVDLGLELSNQQERIGTRHRVLSAAALTRDLSSILTELERLAASPDLLTCPECGMRYVHLKEPRSPRAKQFPPFLSCSGMRIVRKSFEGMQYKDPECRGISKKIRPLVYHR